MNFKVKIRDEKALAAINPAAIRAYALAHGWEMKGNYGDHSEIYRSGDNEIVVPSTENLADYVQVVADLIERFSHMEARTELQILADLSQIDRDVIRLRAPEANQDGSILIEQGVAFIASARDLVQAAACSATGPRAVYRAGNIREANEYLHRVRLGQSERGSYVVALISPIAPRLHSAAQQNLWPDPEMEPFERRAVKFLADGLDAAKTAIEQTNRGGQLEVFETSIKKGISANLCSAAARLIEIGSGLEVSITWAQTRSTPELFRKISFSDSDGLILNEAARLLTEKEPRINEKLEGYVIDLHREPSDEIGRGVLRTFVEQKPTSVRLLLPKALYDIAGNAHLAKFPISITGDLVRDGQRWQLTNSRDLIVLENSDN